MFLQFPRTYLSFTDTKDDKWTTYFRTTSATMNTQKCRGPLAAFDVSMA